MSVATRIAAVLANNPAGMTVAEIAQVIGASKPGTHRAMNKGKDASMFIRSGKVYMLRSVRDNVVIPGYNAPASNPTPAEIIDMTLAALSPENLSCDGELGWKQVAAKRSRLIKQLRDAVNKLGGTLGDLPEYTQAEIHSYLRPRIRPNNPECKKFTKGQRVEIRHNGRVIPGTVIRVNGKTLSVRPDDGSTRYYRATPGICFAI